MARLGLLLLSIWLITSLAACAGSDQPPQQAVLSDDVEAGRSAARGERATKRAERRTAETTPVPANTEPSTNGKPAAIPAQQATETPTTEVETRAKPSAKELVRALLPGSAFGASCFEELLAIIPDAPETRKQLWIYDLDRMRQHFTHIPVEGGYLGFPGPGTDDADLAPWKDYIPPLIFDEEFTQNAPFCHGTWPLIAASRASLTGNVPGWCGSFADWKSLSNLDLGYDMRSIKQIVSTGPPDDSIEILRGDFDPSAADAAVNCQKCPVVDHGGHQGIQFYSWGGDRELMTDGEGKLLAYAPPIFDRVGRAGRVMVQQEYVFRTLTTSRMKALIDAQLGNQTTLRDVEEFRLLAKGLSEVRAYSALLTDHKWELEETRQALSLDKNFSPEELKKLLDQSPLLRPYQAWATGKGKDNNGHYMFLVLAHANSELATQNATLLPSRILEARSVYYQFPWREEFLSNSDGESLGPDTMNVGTNGRILIVKFRAWSAVIRLLALDALYHNDPILLYQQ